MTLSLKGENYRCSSNIFCKIRFGAENNPQASFNLSNQNFHSWSPQVSKILAVLQEKGSCFHKPKLFFSNFSSTIGPNRFLINISKHIIFPQFLC